MDTLHVGKRFFAATGDVSPDQWCIHDGRIALSVPAPESICFGGLNKEEAIALVEMFDRLTEPTGTRVPIVGPWPPAESQFVEKDSLEMMQRENARLRKDLDDNLRGRIEAVNKLSALREEYEGIGKLSLENADFTAKLNALREAVKDFIELSKQQSSISTYSDAMRRLREVYDAN